MSEPSAGADRTDVHVTYFCIERGSQPTKKPFSHPDLPEEPRPLRSPAHKLLGRRSRGISHLETQSQRKALSRSGESKTSVSREYSSTNSGHVKLCGTHENHLTKGNGAASDSEDKRSQHLVLRYLDARSSQQLGQESRRELKLERWSRFRF